LIEEKENNPNLSNIDKDSENNKTISKSILTETVKDLPQENVVQETEEVHVEENIESEQVVEFSTTGGAEIDQDSAVDADEEKDKIDTTSLLNELIKIESANTKDAIYKKMKKFVSHLQEKEKSLEKREKKIEEQLQFLAEGRSQSFSSTQLSTDTFSTGLNKNSKELQQILNDAVNELQSAQRSQDFDSPNASPCSFSPHAQTNLHFAFMFSEPLVLCYIDSHQTVQKSPVLLQVDHSSEQETVKKILRTSKNEVRYRSFVATQAGLGECLNMKPKAIHFCGHGVKNNQENFLFMRDDEGDFLIFEDEEGKADFMSCRALKNLLREKKLEDTIDFVFVASCHSYLVGEVFKEAGAKHVICVGRDEKILDKACQEFTNHFYQAYFTGNFTVCEAFRNAKEHLKSIRGLPPGEENKFVILYEESLFQGHTCTSFFPSTNLRNEHGKGGLKDLTPVPTFHKIPSRVEHFMGRHIELHEVIKLIRSQRFVTIKGIPGIGKSSLCREAVNFLLDRNAFQDGIIYLNLGGCDSIEGIISALDSKLGYLSKDVNSKKESVGNIISQVAHYLDEKIKDTLIILDDVDQVHHKERGKLRDFIEMILLTCSKVKILVTSRSPIGGGFQEAAEKLITVTHLDVNNARELFFSKAPRAIPDSEIKDLLEHKLSLSEEAFLPTNGNYLDHSLMRSKSHNVTSTNHPPNSNFFHHQLCTLKKGASFVTLEGHHLMQILGGHPQAISLAAGLIVERSLKDLYKLLLSHSILDVLKVEDLTEDEAKSMNSMQVSLDVSVNYLKKKHKNSVKFFGLLGLLPGGSQEADLNVIWGKDWEVHVRLLLRYSLIIRSERLNAAQNARYLLYPFMIDYAGRCLKKPDLTELAEKVLVHLKNKAQKIFNKIGSVSPDSHMMFDVFLHEETNFKACIKREMENISKKKGRNIQNSNDEESDDSTFGLTKENLRLLDKFNTGKQEWIRKSNQRPRDLSELNKTHTQEDEEKAKLSDIETEKSVIGTECVAQLLSSGHQNPSNQQKDQSKTPQKKNESSSSSLSNICEEKTVKKSINKENNASNRTSIERKQENPLIEETRKKSKSFPNDKILVDQSIIKPSEETAAPKILDITDSELKEQTKLDAIKEEAWSASIKEEKKVDQERPPTVEITLQDANEEVKEDNILNISDHVPNRDCAEKNTSSLTSFTGSSIAYNTSSLSQTYQRVSKSPKTDQSINITGIETISAYSGNDEVSLEDQIGFESAKTTPQKAKNRERSTSPIPHFPTANKSAANKSETKDLQYTPRFLSIDGENSMREDFSEGAINHQNKSSQEHAFESDLTFFEDAKHDNNYSCHKSEKNLQDDTSQSDKEIKNCHITIPETLTVEGISTTDTQVVPHDITNKAIPSKTNVAVNRDKIPPSSTRRNQEKSTESNKALEQQKRLNVHRESKKSLETEKEAKWGTMSPNPDKDLIKPKVEAKNRLSSSGKPFIAPTGSFKRGGDKKSLFLSASEKKKTMLSVCHLAVLYCSTLFLLRRFNECEKFVGQGIELCRINKDKLGEANFLKLKGCINWIKKNFQSSFKDFSDALDLFRKTGCALGQAICDAAIGYLKAHMLPEEATLNAAIKKLETALAIYKQLDHWFGIHYMHRWLSIVKNKVSYYKTQSRLHSEEARKALNFTTQRKDVYGSKHGAGYFVLRWMGDAFSIFLEVATICDMEPVQKAKDDFEVSETAITALKISRSKLKQKPTIPYSGMTSDNTSESGRNSMVSGKTEESEDGASVIVDPHRNRVTGKSKTGGVSTTTVEKPIPSRMLMPSLRQKRITVPLSKKPAEEEEKQDKKKVLPSEKDKEEKLKTGVKLCLDFEDIKTSTTTTPASKNSIPSKIKPAATVVAKNAVPSKPSGTEKATVDKNIDMEKQKIAASTKVTTNPAESAEADNQSVKGSKSNIVKKTTVANKKDHSTPQNKVWMW